ncbi:hypothetical protein KYT91_1780 (plasmid) [Klebsiella pneumoniae]|uniref:Uncharacterized protein n=1 Tax=Klebsiella pneumoniae subsp. pneumoniae TaxID=72407 RepID=A0A8F7KQD2_KLEPN|nr:hypothetical protein [Klebsiella pneumoniae subsp. pneumoniae]UFX82469.1 hypothetical protein KYT91_1780 [Klebsiella pneumoniae]QXV90470.1 hypothetical protein [Klebsiella pneumoniae subsp. pneumoniae]QXV90902.1 hypothetical protein [Klebsiella pneumoniae subsp. pneumoniae]QXV91932.1 hypothetical protein [Klebsiella pneumoniae subsp. pneumoniae]
MKFMPWRKLLFSDCMLLTTPFGTKRHQPHIAEAVAVDS